MVMQWYTMNADKVLSNFRTDIHGLSRAEVELRRKTYGENAMPEAKQKTLPVIFLEQFKSSIIYILLVATVIVGAMGDYTDALVILAVLLINAIIGTFQEGKAQNTLAALTKFVTTHSLVRRTNEDMIVLDRELVPGDIIIIREGDKIPADARILEHESLSVDESALTGESAPIHKTHNPMTADNLSSAEQKNMVFRGTFAVGGHAVAVVTETGLETVIGGISKQVQSIDADMPIKKNIGSIAVIGTLANNKAEMNSNWAGDGKPTEWHLQHLLRFAFLLPWVFLQIYSSCYHYSIHQQVLPLRKKA